MTTLKQSTAYTHQFLMVDNTTHINGATGKAPVVKLGKNGATGVTATNSPATEVDSSNLPGVYSIVLAATDVGTLGSLAITATASGADPYNEFFKIDSQVFTDLNIDSSTGRAKIFSGVQQNSSFILPFVMTVNGVPNAAVSNFTAQRSLAGAGFGPCANPVVNDGGGWYHILLVGTDTNASVIEFHITAVGADDRNITLYTQP